MRAAAVVCAVIAAGAMGLAIRGMVIGQDARTGWLLRLVAVCAFLAAVALNVAAK